MKQFAEYLTKPHLFDMEKIKLITQSINVIQTSQYLQVLENGKNICETLTKLLKEEERRRQLQAQLNSKMEKNQVVLKRKIAREEKEGVKRLKQSNPYHTRSSQESLE
jgi:excinuclease UvrABC helicase subunit UvrB